MNVMNLFAYFFVSNESWGLLRTTLGPITLRVSYTGSPTQTPIIRYCLRQQILTKSTLIESLGIRRCNNALWKSFTLQIVFMRVGEQSLFRFYQHIEVVGMYLVQMHGRFSRETGTEIGDNIAKEKYEGAAASKTTTVLKAKRTDSGLIDTVWSFNPKSGHIKSMAILAHHGPSPTCHNPL